MLSTLLKKLIISLEITSPPIGRDTLRYLEALSGLKRLEITSPPIGRDTSAMERMVKTMQSLEITSPPIGRDTPVNSVFEQKCSVFESLDNAKL